MSLKFEISLSFPQVQMLLAFVNMEKEGKVVSGKQVRKATVATAIALVSEGLVTHKKAKVIGTPGEWKVTRKGYMVANLIREEMSEMQTLPNRPSSKQIEHIFWYDLPPNITSSAQKGKQ